METEEHRLQIDRIRAVQQVYERYRRQALREVANEDFSVADVRVMHELYLVGGEGGCGSWLAYVAALDPTYVCRILDKLKAYGLVASRPATADRRKRNWSLTDRGKAFADTIEREYREQVHRVLFDLLPDEQRQLCEALAVIEPLLQQLDARRW